MYRSLRRVRLNRHWRAFFVALVGCAVLGLIGAVFFPRLAGLFLLMIYCIPANSVLPIPHEPAVLYVAQFYHPVWVALAATIGTVAVSFADYAVVEAALRHPKMHAARDKGLFGWALRWMKRAPFWIIVLFSFTPLPISIVRVLAPASGYPVRRYVLAQIVGRYPRFLLLAWIGHAVMIPGWALLVMFGVLLGVMWLGARSSMSDEVAADDDEDEDTETDEPAIQLR